VTCRSWRPLAGATMSGRTAPGGRARQWRPCRNKVARGESRCPECATALLTHPNPQVRLALVRDQSATVSQLRALAGDMDISVAHPAQRELNRRLAVEDAEAARQDS